MTIITMSSFSDFLSQNKQFISDADQALLIEITLRYLTKEIVTNKEIDAYDAYIEEIHALLVRNKANDVRNITRDHAAIVGLVTIVSLTVAFAPVALAILITPPLLTLLCISFFALGAIPASESYVAKFTQRRHENLAKGLTAWGNFHRFFDLNPLQEINIENNSIKANENQNLDAAYAYAKIIPL